MCIRDSRDVYDEFSGLSTSKLHQAMQARGIGCGAYDGPVDFRRKLRAYEAKRQRAETEPDAATARPAAWQGEKVSRRRQSLVALGAALPRRRRASPPAPTFEKDVLAETPSSAAPAAGRRRRTRPVPGSLPAVTPVPPVRPRPTAAAEHVEEPPRRKKPCFGGASVETLEAIEARFLGATLPAQ